PDLGSAGRDRQCLRRAGRGRGARNGDGAVDLERLCRRPRRAHEAGARVRGVDRAAALASAGTVREGTGSLIVDFLNPAFWTFVAVIAGIYAIMALGLYVQFSLAGLPNFGHVAFMATAAYVMAILVVRYHVPLA